MRWVLSARDGAGWLAEQPAELLQPGTAGTDGLPVVFVDANHRFQQVLGFGGAFTEAAALTWQRLDAPAREELLRAYFDPVHGHGYTLGRVHMGSCDFALGNYAHAAQDGDFALAGFDIARDRQALLPFIRAAQAVAGAPLQLLASPWSPPAWMKTNGQMNGGGRLRPECRDAWAGCYAKFIAAYAREGVPIWGVSVQNEPMAAQRWDSCLWSAEEERDFVRDHLAPALDRAGLGHVQIVVWDHNRDAMVERASVIYADPQVRSRVWGCGFHWYVEDHFDHVRLVHDAWPDKHLLFTEGCQEGGPHAGAWEVGERYARSMIHDLNRWTEGWIDWNLLLDEHGGPNHVGNYCSAPMLADTAAGRLLPQSAYACIGHFARFVRPGARRVLCAATREALECTAFVDADGHVATIVTNRGEAPQTFVLRRAGVADDRIATLPPRAIATFVG